MSDASEALSAFGASDARSLASVPARGAAARAAERELVGLFERLVDNLAPRVRRFLGRWVGGPHSDADDLTQEVFIRVWQAMLRGELPNRVETWVFAIARNVGRDHLRRTTVRRAATPTLEREREDEERAHGERSERAVSAKVEGAELRHVLTEALSELPESFRIAFVLREQEGLSYEEIALITESPIKTVSSRLVRARQFLRQRFVAAGLHPATEATQAKGSPS